MTSTFSELQEKLTELQFIPIADNKLPIPTGWQKFKGRHDFKKAKGIGLVCGSISGNVEAIDIDCKYDLTGKLFDRFKTAINQADKNLLKKMVVQQTVSNGYHFIYRCETIEGNKKLAQREATDQEKLKGDKIKVLIETRGEGGYIAIYPTGGYKLIYGTLEKINSISPEERETVFKVARSFNEAIKEYVPEIRKEKKHIKGLTPFEDYNTRGDVVSLLENHGWKVVDKKGKKTIFLRPGQTTSASSGNFDEDRNWFTVFTTSSEFEVGTAYLPYAVFAFLETNKDFSQASKKLYDLGYGDRVEKAKDNDTKTPSRIDLLGDDYSFLAKPSDYDDYLTSWRNGSFQLGLSTGFSGLDKHFRFKRGNLVVINGHDNVGKSTVIWYMALVSALLHKWRWIIFSSENTVGGVVKKLIEFYWCQPIASMSEQKYHAAKKFIEQHFAIIKTDSELYNYKDVLNMATLLSKKSKYDSLMIDPYNSLKIELTSSSKLSTHEYHYEAVSEMKLYGKQNDMCVYVNCHAVTNALRQVGADKLAQAPQKADTEGGGKFSNKADDFITIHRKVQSPDEWMFTEIHIRKIKETETGGKITPLNEPVRIRMVKGLVGFDSEEENPVLNFHKIPSIQQSLEGRWRPLTNDEKPF